MNEQTAEVLKQIADKLGTTAEQLWAGLVAYAPFAYMQWITLIIGAGAVLLVGSVILVCIFKSEKLQETLGEACGMVAIATAIFSFVSLAVLLLEGAGRFGEAMAAKHAPEAWAVKQIFKRVER